MAFLSGWTKRIKLTIDHTKIDSSLSHFPVTVILSSTQGEEVFTELGSDANRKKIAFTKTDGTTQLYGEIEQFDYTNSKAVYHVSASGWTISSSTDTDFYLYYNSSHADNTSYIGDIGSTSGEHVWDSNFKMVQHMVDDTTSTILDSTSNSYNGTKKAANEPIETDDVVGKAQSFDGTGDSINIGDIINLEPTSNFTLTILCNPNKPISYGALCGNVLSGNQAGYIFDYSTDNIAWSVGNGSGWNTVSKVYTETHHIVTGVLDGTTPKLYYDGIYEGAASVVTPSYSGTQFEIGKYYNHATNDNRFNGEIVEVRFSDSVRSASWIKATYNSLWDKLLTYGSTSSAPTSINVIFFGANF